MWDYYKLSAEVYREAARSCKRVPRKFPRFDV